MESIRSKVKGIISRANQAPNSSLSVRLAHTRAIIVLAEKIDQMNGSYMTDFNISDLEFIYQVISNAMMNSDSEEFDAHCALVLPKITGLITAKKIERDG